MPVNCARLLSDGGVSAACQDRLFHRMLNLDALDHRAVLQAVGSLLDVGLLVAQHQEELFSNHLFDRLAAKYGGGAAVVAAMEEVRTASP